MGEDRRGLYEIIKSFTKSRTISVIQEIIEVFLGLPLLFLFERPYMREWFNLTVISLDSALSTVIWI